VDSCEETSAPHCCETKAICRNAERPPFCALPNEAVCLSEGEAPTPIHSTVDSLLRGLDIRVLNNEIHELNRPTKCAVDTHLLNLIRDLNDGAVCYADLQINQPRMARAPVNNRKGGAFGLRC